MPLPRPDALRRALPVPPQPLLPVGPPLPVGALEGLAAPGGEGVTLGEEVTDGEARAVGELLGDSVADGLAAPLRVAPLPGESVEVPVTDTEGEGPREAEEERLASGERLARAAVPVGASGVSVRAAEVVGEARRLLEAPPALPDTVAVASRPGEAVGSWGEGLGDLLPPLPSLALGAAPVAVAQAVALPASAPHEAVAGEGEAEGWEEGLPGRRVGEREGVGVAAAGEGEAEGVGRGGAGLPLLLAVPLSPREAVPPPPVRAVLLREPVGEREGQEEALPAAALALAAEEALPAAVRVGERGLALALAEPVVEGD